MTTADLPAAQRRAIARQGAYAQQAKYNVKEITAKARQVFRESFAATIRERHPELDEDEVQRRADAARRSWYVGLARKSAKVRARRKARKANHQNKLDAPEPLPVDPARSAGGMLDGEGSGSAHTETQDGR